MEAASIAEILAENKARLSEAEEDQGRGEDVFWRYWLVGQDDLDGCIAYLKAMTTVASPMTGTRWARTGTWYAGRVRYRPGNDNPLVASGAAGLVWLLYQELSKGTKEITINEDCAAWTKQRVINTYNPSIPSGTAVAGTIVRVGATPTDLGREQTTKETTTPKDQTATARDDSAAAGSVKVLHTEGAALAAPSAVAGTIIRQTAQPTEAGNERTVVETITVKDQTATAGDDSAAASASKVTHTEAAAEAGAQSAAAGTIVRSTSTPTEAGKYRNTVETITVKDQTATAGDDSAAASASKVTHTEAAAETGAQSAVAGTIVRSTSTPTEAGKFRNVVETITVKDQTATAGDDSAAASASKVTHTEAAAETGAQSAAAGTIVRSTSTPTEAGKYRNVVETIVPKDQVEVSYEESAFESGTRALHTENSSALGTPTHEAGKIKESINLPTEAGNTKTEARERTAIARTTSFTSAISDDVEATTEKGHNADAMPEIAAVDNADVTLDGDMNPFHKYDYVKRTMTATIPKSCAGTVSWVTYGNDYRINNLQYSSTEKRFYYTSYWIYRERIYHGIGFYLTAALAAAALPTICAAIGGVNVDHGSRVYKAGNNLWMANVQSRNDLLVSTTTGLDPVWV
ncbi:MAG: hypothetical protein WC359_12640 [Dehalococcoidia bacterium]|jgi:hypothetical protein